ncbi:MAG: hypothetical protein GXO89_12405 [Chlorobi bacterium]|nr:hypothetical protein [Chlorobiota bacterium]
MIFKSIITRRETAKRGIKTLDFLFLMFVLTTLNYSCKDTIEGIKVTNYYDACPAFNTDLGDLATFKDPNNLFSIRFPYNWDVRESFSDTLYGIFGANMLESSSDIEKLESISAVAYQTIDSLEVYAANEIRGLKNESNIKVKQVGRTVINGNKVIWVLFKSKEELTSKGNLVIYIKKPSSNILFILQASVYSSDNYKERLCNLKQLLNTFKLSSN